MIVCYKSNETGKIYVLATGTVNTKNRNQPYNEVIREDNLPKLSFMLNYDFHRNQDENGKSRYEFNTVNCVMFGTGFISTNYTLAKQLIKKGAKLLVAGTYNKYTKKDRNGNTITGDEIWVDFILPIEALSALLLKFETDIGDYYIKKREMRAESRLTAKKEAAPETKDEEETPEDDYDFD